MKRWYWIARDGTNVDLMSEPFLLMREVVGHLMPTFQRDEHWVGSFGVLMNVYPEAREVVLPLLVRSDSLHEALRLCAQYFSPFKDGVLRVEDESKTARILRCSYVGGLEGNGDGGGNWQRVLVRLRALDPYWESERVKQYSFSPETPVVFFQVPFFPMRISKSSVDGTVVVNNDGDVDAYPIFVFRGPFSAIEVQNVTTGKTMSFPSVAMSSSDVLVVNTHPTMMSVKLNDANGFSLMSVDSSLWRLEAGCNTVKIISAGTNMSSLLEISFVPRYFTV